jgi:putative thiamine transport system substrate-binding protein
VSDADFDSVTAPLWAYLDALRPALWRQGAAYPQTQADLRPLLADNEIDIAFAFDPAAASAAIADHELPDTVRAYVLDGGTIGNASFVAIPYDAAHKAAALAAADFLLSPEAQARKQDPAVWGGSTVLSMDRLSADDRARFDRLALGVATPSPQALGTPLPEPHPSWMVRIGQEWKRRYGQI